MLHHFGHVQLYVTPWTAAHQAPLSMGLSEQEYWSGFPGPPPGIFLTQGSNRCLLHLCLLHGQAGFLPLAPPYVARYSESHIRQSYRIILKCKTLQMLKVVYLFKEDNALNKNLW